MRPLECHKCSLNSRLKLTQIQMVPLVLLVPGTPCKTEQAARARGLGADIKDLLVELVVVIYHHSLMLTACRIPTLATVHSYKSFSVRVQVKQLRLILRAEERSACPP